MLEPPPDGWHDTGDIVAIDAAGFITIKGRAKRFAKIAGEMVSLSAVEAHRRGAVAAGDFGRGVAAGCAQGRAPRAADHAEGRRRATPCSARPRRTARPSCPCPRTIMVVDKVPLLGSGKTDYVAATAMAKEIASVPEQDVA